MGRKCESSRDSEVCGCTAWESGSKGCFYYDVDLHQGSKGICKAATIILVDGDDLANLMMDFNVGVAVDATYEIKRIDSDFFEEE